MVQVPVLARLVGLLGRPKSFLPHLKVDDIRQINFQSLRDLGYKGVVFDKDNCLTKPYVDTVEPHLKESLASSIRAFGSGNVLMVSNSSGTRNDPGHLGAEALHRATQAPVLLHSWKKPGCYNEVWTYFYRRQELLSKSVFPEPNAPSMITTTTNTTPDTLPIEAPLSGGRTPELGLVVIGDRLLTDTLLTSLIRPPPTTTSNATAPTTVSSVVTADLPVNLSILTTKLHSPNDVRVLRALERLIEKSIRRLYSLTVPAVDVTDERWREAGVLVDGKGCLAPRITISGQQLVVRDSKIQTVKRIASSIGSTTKRTWRGIVSGWTIIRQEGLGGLAVRARDSTKNKIDRSRERLSAQMRTRWIGLKHAVSERIRMSWIGRLSASVVSLNSRVRTLISRFSRRVVVPNGRTSKSRID